MAYIDSLIGYLAEYFETWPEWVALCNSAFNFLNDFELADRKVSFGRLMNMPHDEKMTKSFDSLTST